MGWFDSFTGSGPDVDSSTSKSPSPLEKLDPQLRDFLQRESQSKKQQTREDSAKQQQLQQERHDPAQPTPDATSPAGTTTASATAVPPESLFPDGRYAHLWRTYRRQADVEEEAKTEHEKVADVVAAYEARKAGIARAALENCALEQESWDRCARGSGWWDRSTGCVALQRRFQKCYDMNTRLLKVLGYLSTLERTPEVEERIQMQADALWQRMQAQEDAIAQAKREGRPAPEFASIFLPATATASSQQGSSGPQGSGQLSSQQATPQQSTDEQLFASPQFRAGLEARLKGLSDSTEAAAEEAAFRAEWIARAEAAEGVRRFRQARDERERQEREQRRAAGGDGVGGSWWDGIARRVWGER